MSYFEVQQELYYEVLRPFGGDEPAGEIALDALVDRDDVRIPHETSIMRAALVANGYTSAQLKDGTQCMAKLLESKMLLVVSGERKAFPFNLNEPLRFAVLSVAGAALAGHCNGLHAALRLESLRSGHSST